MEDLGNAPSNGVSDHAPAPSENSVPTTATVPSTPVSSSREALERAFQSMEEGQTAPKADRARDEHGRFAKALDRMGISL